MIAENIAITTVSDMSLLPNVALKYRAGLIKPWRGVSVLA